MSTMGDVDEIVGATGYDRTRDATMSLENLNFKLKPVAALHI